jgi:hypothetical protein
MRAATQFDTVILLLVRGKREQQLIVHQREHLEALQGVLLPLQFFCGFTKQRNALR